MGQDNRHSKMALLPHPEQSKNFLIGFYVRYSSLKRLYFKLIES